MIGVFFAIDVLVLDSKKRIIEIKRDFKPLQFYTTKRAGLYLVEIPAGNLGPTRVGDQLAFPTV